MSIGETLGVSDGKRHCSRHRLGVPPACWQGQEEGQGRVEDHHMLSKLVGQHSSDSGGRVMTVLVHKRLASIHALLA